MCSPDTLEAWQTFWTGVAAVATILGAGATIAAILYSATQYREEIKREKEDKKANIYSALSLEVFSNLKLLTNSHMSEILLSTSAYDRLKQNIELFNISGKDDLILQLDQLYSNFIFYNHTWQLGKVGAFLEEIKIRIFIYFLYFCKVKINKDKFIDDLSYMLDINLKFPAYNSYGSEINLDRIEFIQGKLKERENVFFTNEYLKSKIYNHYAYIPKPKTGEEEKYNEIFNLEIVKDFKDYLKDEFKLDQHIDIELITRLIQRLNQ